MLSAEHHTAINISFFIDGADYEEILPVRYDTPVDYLATNRARALQYAFLCPQFELPIQAQSHKSKFWVVVRKHKYLSDVLVVCVFHFAFYFTIFNYYQVIVRISDCN